jgi:shikimate dehydrogenase
VKPSFLCGLIGSGIQSSRTPPMHEREGDEQGLRLLYQKIDLAKLGLGAEALPELLSAAERMGFSGLNVTHPCKQAVIPLLDELSPDAEALGAVNTVVLRDGKRIGHNTDWWGFAENFRRNMADAPRRHVVQFGAGGAGSAVAYALMTLGVENLTVVDVDCSRAEVVAAGLCARFGANRVKAGTEDAVATADGVVNTTPLGMDKYPGMPLRADLLRAELWVSEIVYFPIETALLRAARAAGCAVCDGGTMAVGQAVGAFRLFTGLEPDAERMRRHFLDLIAPLDSTSVG